MTEYAGIKGTKVKYLTSDPTLTSDYEGQVWYNSTTGVNKSLVQIKSWASSGNMPVGRSGVGGCGTQTSALSVGGEDGSTIYGTCFEYNGAGWIDGGSLNDSPSFFCPIVGIQTAAMRAGGFTGTVGTDAQNAVENYDGSSWTTGTDIPTARGLGVIAGTQTAAILAGGSPGVVTDSFLWNGSSWTATNSLLEAKQNAAPAGVSTAMLASGGADGTPGTGGFTENVQTWDGTNWSSAEDLTTARSNVRGWGTNTDAIAAGGRTRAPSSTNLCEQYDGTSWSATANLGTAVYLGGTGGGTSGSTAGCYFGGGHPLKSATEEYNAILTSATAPSWTAGGNLGTGRYILAGAGTQTAGLVFAGFPTPGGNTEEYNGTSWSEQNNYPGAPKEALGGLGTQTAALGFGGYNPTPVQTATNEYNGTSWTAGGALNTAKRRCRGCGIQTAGVTAGGVTGGPNSTRTDATEEYNGSSWTTVNAMPGNARRSNVLVGSQTAAMTIGGDNGPTTAVENYDGTNWTTGTSLPLGQSSHSGDGTTSSAWTAGGAVTGTPTGITQIYNGTSWSLGTEMTNGRGESGFSSSQSTSAGFVAGGGAAPIRSGTEEFDVGTAAVTTASTLTTS